MAKVQVETITAVKVKMPGRGEKLEFREIPAGNVIQLDEETVKGLVKMNAVKIHRKTDDSEDPAPKAKSKRRKTAEPSKAPDENQDDDSEAAGDSSGGEDSEGDDESPI